MHNIPPTDGEEAEYSMVPMKTSIVCAACRGIISEEDQPRLCPNCQAPHHPSCWEEQHGCQTAACHHDDEAVALTSMPAATREASKALPWIVGVAVLVALAISAITAIFAGVRIDFVLLVGVVIAALVFDYVNGMHDAGNAIATVISTRVLTPVAALIMAAVLNLVGALVHSGVAKNIATNFADPSVPAASITPLMILCGLIGASSWSFFTARIGLPVSTSHSLFGGLIGVFLLGSIKLNMAYMTLLGSFIILAPLIAFVAGWLLMMIIMWIFRSVAPFKINRHFRFLQMLSSASVAFTHGSNDAQKAMGIITMALISGGFWEKSQGIPLWVKVSCALVIAIGTALGGMRVIKTLGHKIIKLDPVHGFAAETVAAATIQLVTSLKIPVSTTHVISSSILGIGASKRLSAVRWGVAANMITAWVLTIPTCAAAGAFLYWLVSLLSGLR